MDRKQTLFRIAQPIPVASRQLTPVPLSIQPGASDHVTTSASGGIRFVRRGWYEVLLSVAWPTTNGAGTRFAHTKIPGEQPLHSEAISAGVLNELSSGKQLLRGNSLFGPGWDDELVLEVWQDSGDVLVLDTAELVVRDLGVPWPPNP